MDASCETRAGTRSGGAIAKPEDARARPRRPARHFRGRLVAAHCGDGVLRIEPRVNDLLAGLEAVGEVMALTRNESAVHEKIGVYDKVVTGEHNAMVLGERDRSAHLPEGLGARLRGREARRRRCPPQPAVLRRGGRGRPQGASAAGLESRRLSEAGRRRWLRPTSRQTVVCRSRSTIAEADAERRFGASVDELRERWSRLTDMHQFFGMLRDAEARPPAGGADDRRRLCLAARRRRARRDDAPCRRRANADHVLRRQPRLHPDPFRPDQTIKPMGPWINVLDETFHLHLRLDHIREVWAVRKPTKDGHVTSIEAYDARRRDDHPVLRQAPGRRGRARRLARSWSRTCRASRCRPRHEETDMMSFRKSLARRCRSTLVGGAASPARLARIADGGRGGLPRSVAPRRRSAARSPRSSMRSAKRSRLIARDSTSVYPPSRAGAARCRLHARAVAGRRAVGQADGILALEGSGPKEAVDVLKKASVSPTSTCRRRFDHDGILDKIERRRQGARRGRQGRRRWRPRSTPS